MRKFIGRLAVAGILALGSGTGLAQTKWVLPVAWPADNYHTQVLQKFVEEVEKGTNGKLKISIYPNASLFKMGEIKRAVQQGQAQIGQSMIALHENEDPIFGLDTLPFLATNFDEARRLDRTQKPLLESRLRNQRMRYLFSTPWNPQGLYSVKPIGTIQDLKGLKWRSYNSATARLAEMLGAQPVTIQTSEMPQALATGMVEAYMSSSASGYDAKVWEQLSYFYDVQSWLPKNITFVNERAFSALDKSMQDVVLAAAAKAQEHGWKVAEDKTNWYVAQLRARGMKVEPGNPKLVQELKKLGEQMKSDWVQRAGPEGKAAIDAYLQAK